MILPNFSLNYFIFYFIIFTIILFSLNYFLKKKKLFIHQTYDNTHKRKSSSTVVLSGGLFFLIIFIITNIQNGYHLLNLTIYSIFFFGIGYFSDTNNITSSKGRLFIMFIISFILIINSQIIIDKIDIKIIDSFLRFNLISLLFVHIFTLKIFSNEE